MSYFGNMKNKIPSPTLKTDAFLGKTGLGNPGGHPYGAVPPGATGAAKAGTAGMMHPFGHRAHFAVGGAGSSDVGGQPGEGPGVGPGGIGGVGSGSVANPGVT